MSALRSPDADPPRPTLGQRAADLTSGLARAVRRRKAPPAPIAAQVGADPLFAQMDAADAQLFASALMPEVSPGVRAALTAVRATRHKLNLDPDESDDATSRNTDAVDAAYAALRAAPSATLADLRAKVVYLLPSILDLVEDGEEGEQLKHFRDDIERLATRAVEPHGHDLSACTLPQLARLYEAAAGLYDHALGACSWPCFIDRETGGYTPAGEVLDAEYDRIGKLLDAIAREARHRQSKGDERYQRIALLVANELRVEGKVRDRGLLAEAVAAWEA